MEMQSQIDFWNQLQVLMCVYDENKASLKTKSGKECIRQITKQIQAFVEKDRIGLNSK